MIPRDKRTKGQVGGENEILWILDEAEIFNIAFDGCWELAGGECP